MKVIKISFFGWHNCPRNVKSQINKLVEFVKEAPEVNVEGVYLHGSLAMGCFNPDRSDLDILVITKDNMNVNIKRVIIEKLLSLSKQPCPIEISFLSKRHLFPWEFPTPFDLHYSEMWREAYINQLKNQEWKKWNEKTHKDADLAAHILVTLNRGICLYGKPVKEVFPPVPLDDYQTSILLDYKDAREKIGEKPVYAVLTFCRVYFFLLEKGIASKQEGALWGIKNLPSNFRKMIKEVLAVYQGDIEEKPINIKELKEFDAFIKQKIDGLLEEERTTIAR